MPCDEMTKWGPRYWGAFALVLLSVPATLAAGFFWLGTSRYYLVSTLIAVEAIGAFFLAFEGKRPQAREIVTLSVLAALAIAGRAAFFMTPQFKPTAAVIILAGAAMGAQSGFMTGAVTALLSNFLFGQGPWTPWQMVAFGLLGFLAGILFRPGGLPLKKGGLCVFGGLAILLVYGLIMNVSSVLLMSPVFSWQLAVAACTAGLPMDLIHGVSTMIFLFFFSEPFLKKIGRVRKKFGLERR
jgi:uncharacterized membrane protein